MKEKIKELGKRLLTIVVALAMVVTCVPGTAFGAEISEKVKKNVRVPDTFTTELDNKNEYVVPLTFYGPSGKLLRRSLIRVQFRITWIMLH